MEETKGLLKSVTFWGVVVSVLGKVIGLWGYELTPEDAQQIVSGVSLVGSFAGDLIALVGRVRASKKIA